MVDDGMFWSTTEGWWEDVWQCCVGVARQWVPDCQSCLLHGSCHTSVNVLLLQVSVGPDLLVCQLYVAVCGGEGGVSWVEATAITRACSQSVPALSCQAVSWPHTAVRLSHYSTSTTTNISERIGVTS